MTGKKRSPQTDDTRTEISLDKFLDGKISLYQPKKGFRAGLDSILLGAAVSTEAKTMLDLGSGVGTAGIAALAHNKNLHVHFLDSNEGVLALCARNIKLNGFAPRAHTLALDVTAKGAVRQAANLNDDSFDCVIANPPYYDSGTINGLTDAYKKAAFVSPAGALENWIKTATACTKQGGEVIFIHRTQALPALLAGFQSRLGNVEIIPFAPYAGAAAGRVLIKGTRGARGELTMHATRFFHRDKGAPFTPEIEEIMRGRAVLHWNSTT